MAYIGKSIGSGTFSVLDTSGNTYNGSNVTFSLGTQVGSTAQLLVSHDGVIQKPGTDYTLASGGTQITFTTAPASGASIFIVEISGAVGGPLDSDLNGSELILDSDGDTSITADTDDQIDVRVGGSDRFKLDNSGHLSLLTDSGAIKFGADSDVTLTHDPDDGLFLKSIATGDDNPVLLTLQTGETDIAADDVIGAINFQAPDEGTGTDAILVAAGIEAVSEGDFSSSSNATKLSFKTGASEAAAEKMSLSSAGLLTLTSNDPNIKMIDTNTNSYAQLTNTNGTISIEADKGDGSGSSEVRITIDDDNCATFNHTGGDDQFFVHATANPSGGTKGFAVLGQIIVSGSSSTSEQDVMRIEKPSGRVGSITADNSNAAYNTSSDYRLKENVDYTFDATTRLKQLKPARFNWIIDDTNTLQDGFLAHEVSSIVPEAITGTKDATETKTKVVVSSTGVIMAEGVEQSDWTQGKIDEIYPSNSTWEASKTIGIYQQIDQSKLVPLLVKTVQELEARIATLEG